MRLPLRRLTLAAAAVMAISAQRPDAATAREIWTPDRANAWSREQPWLVGCNFITSSAINQLEMWQPATFDPAAIDRELGYAQGLGFTSVRVFLHHLLWESDREGLLKRMDQFLEAADRHKIGVMFVLLDSVWDPYPKAGPQPAPRPHVHNSGWVQSPGADILKDPARHGELEGYIKGVVGRFRADRRVQVWDVINEPDNSNGSSYGKLEPANKADLAVLLLGKVFAWAREADPSQPLTCGVWLGEFEEKALRPIERLQLEGSDVISFHDYSPKDHLEARLNNLRHYGRPVLCTEYMARPIGSRFDPNLGFLREQNVGAYNWGFVDGKSQTIYPWDSWGKTYDGEPPLWFHDIFRRDGTPYDPKEVEYIRGVTAKARR